MNNQKPNRQDWFGYITNENIDDVAVVIEEILNNQKFSFASMTWLGAGFEPEMEIRTSEQLKEILTYEWGFHVYDSWGVWSIDIDAFISFENWKITIKQKSASGNDLTWLIAVEREKIS